jgi:thioesterase domain-containing protein
MPRGRPAKYPWETWTDGQRHVLVQGDHFSDEVKVTSFRAECHAAARRKGGKADTRIMGNTVIFRYLEDV